MLLLPGATVRHTFVADLPGTYFYWGALAGTEFIDRAAGDALLNSGWLELRDAAGALFLRQRIEVVAPPAP